MRGVINMGFLDRLFGFTRSLSRGRYASFEGLLSGKIRPASELEVRDQLLRLAEKDEKLRKALTAYVESGEYKKSPFIKKEGGSSVIKR
ncbi:MAG: hypothetical protein JW778_03055 [Candidatus Altiarchaeota archaeon]|nr:hypothetical protein [Candidatus Altiarchaeota archaeon]